MSFTNRFDEHELWPIAIDWDLAFSRPETQQGYRYWQSLRQGRAMPERRELDPRAMARFLSFVNLVEMAPARAGAWNYTVTLQGSHSREVLGAAQGRSLAEIFPKPAFARWRSCFDLPRSGRMPVRLLTRASIRGKHHLACEALLAPLGRSPSVEALFWVFAAWRDGRSAATPQAPVPQARAG
ncbi:MAG TPA: PAS domain-containing protein [Rhizomicrobium sp.]|jgi:hypothetical protein